MSWWFEPLLLSTRLARADGRLVEPLEPVPVERELRLGRRGSEGVDFEWELGRTLIITPSAQGLRFKWENARRELVLAAGEVWTEDGVGGACLRVLSDDRGSCGWPSEVPAPLGPWSDDLLSVLGDSLLDAGCAVGARLNGREPSQDNLWLPLLPLLPPPARRVRWRRGVVDTLSLRTSIELGTQFEVELQAGAAEGYVRLPTLTWPLGRSLASHAVCKPMRKLELFGTFEGRNDLLRLVAGLAAGGGLPCLEEIVCELSSEAPEALELRAFERELKGLPGVAAGLPTVRSVQVVRVQPRR
jgi:hypothetical protein